MWRRGALHTLEGHTEYVKCVAMDGSRVVSGSDDTSVKVWDLDKPDGNKLLYTLVGHTRSVMSVAVMAACGERELGQDRQVDGDEGALAHLRGAWGSCEEWPSMDRWWSAGVRQEHQCVEFGDRESLHTLMGHTNDVMSVAIDGSQVSGVMTPPSMCGI